MSRFVLPIVVDQIPEARFITAWWGHASSQPATDRPDHPLAKAPAGFECQEGGEAGELVLLTRQHAVAEAAKCNAQRLASGEWERSWSMVMELKLGEPDGSHEFSDGEISLWIRWKVLEVEITTEEIGRYRNVQPLAEPAAVA
jgi:hypothetical protein